MRTIIDSMRFLRPRGNIVLAAISLLWPLLGSAGRLPMHFYRTSQGLPRNSVNCMVAGQNGIMWFCTTEGLVRFDGHDFRVFGPEHGLPSRTVYHFAPTHLGGYWVITDRGLCRLEAESKIGDTCRPFTQSAPVAWSDGFLAESPRGEVWAASDTRIFRVQLASRTLEDIAFPLDQYEHVLALAAGDAGTLLVGSEYSVYEWMPGGKVRNLAAGMKDMGTRSILRLPSGDYWLGTAGGLVRLRLNGSAQTPEFRGGWMAEPGPNDLKLSHDGSIWISVGLAILQVGIDSLGNARTLRRIGPGEGLPRVVSTVAEDSTGRLWASVEGDGVLRIDDNGFIAYAETEGLDHPRIASIFTDRAGRLCVTTSWYDYGSVRLWHDNRFLTFRISFPSQLHSFGQGWNQFGLQAHDGEWWIPTAEGLLRFGAARTENLVNAPVKNWYRYGAGLPCRDIFRVFEDSGGDIWVSCDGPDGVLRWDRRTERFRNFGPAEGWLPNQFAMVFRESPPGTIWMVMENRVVRFHDGHFQYVPLGTADATTRPRDMFIDSARRVWIATAGKGLFRCDDSGAAQPSFVNYTTRDGLASAFLRAVTEDRRGFIYVSSVRGVDRIDPRAAVDPAHIRHFTAADGLPDNEHNVAFTDPRGHLWFGTLHGLAEYDPSRAPAPTLPDVFFTRLLVRGDEIPLAWDGARHAALELAPDRNQIQIEFFGADSNSPENLRFQYRLAGAPISTDPQWSEPAAQTRVNYPALPAGRLHFEVRAINADGQVSGHSATLDLDVAAPFWRRGWFLALLALSAAGVGALAYRYRVDQLLALERLRTRIATDLHDDIGANLSQIAILSEVARTDSGRGSLEVISRIARETVEQMSDIVWAVNPRHDRFHSMLHRMRRFADDTLGGAGIELEFEAGKLPADLTTPIEVRRPLYLMFKEAVNNAARHSGASRVTVGIELVRGVLRMTIADNGRGFDPLAPHEGEGVASIGRRMRDLGGTVEWETAASPSGRGTRLVLTLPLQRARPHLSPT
jgi:signal transduction histidine kinase/ligand-binding sensor domain-containing protein